MTDRRHPPDSQPGTPHDGPQLGDGERERALVARYLAAVRTGVDGTEPIDADHQRADVLLASLNALRPTEPERPERFTLDDRLERVCETLRGATELLRQDHEPGSPIHRALLDVQMEIEHILRSRPTEEPGE